MAICRTPKRLGVDAMSLDVIGLTGNARAGKNHVGNILRDQFRYLPWALAFPLKQRIYSIHDEWPIENVIGQAGKSPELRALMQQEGTERGRDAIRQDIWIRATEAFLYLAETEWTGLVEGVVICDVRFPDEAEYVKSLGGRVYRVLNDDLDLSLPMYQHRSELFISSIPVDGCVDNTGHPDDYNLAAQLDKLFIESHGVASG